MSVSAPISELLAVKLENISLKIQLLQVSLHQQQQAYQSLLAESRVSVSAPVGVPYNPTTHTFAWPDPPVAAAPAAPATPDAPTTPAPPSAE